VLLSCFVTILIMSLLLSDLWATAVGPKSSR
jgi:hypothetical protein